MKIEMGAPAPAPVWPAGIGVRTNVPGIDDRAMYEADQEAFQDHYGYVPVSLETWLHLIKTCPDFDPVLFFLAIDLATGEIAGVSLCAPYLTESPDTGYLADLGVRRPYRRKGLGLALLRHTFGELYRRGTTKVSLAVDSDSLTNAVALYERAGMHVYREFHRYEKELRPGRELTPH